MPNHDEELLHCFQIHQHVSEIDPKHRLFVFVEQESGPILVKNDPCQLFDQRSHVHCPTDACHSHDWETIAWEAEVSFNRNYLNEKDNGNPNKQHAELRERFQNPSYSVLNNFDIHPSFIHSILIQRGGVELAYP